MQKLKARSDFLRLARGLSFSCVGVVVQTQRRSPAPQDHCGPRVGFTVTKKLGSAVVRNRIKRRLSSVVRLLLDKSALLPDHDYVFIGRHGTLSRPFPLLCEDLGHALSALHSGRGRVSPPRHEKKRKR